MSVTSMCVYVTNSVWVVYDYVITTSVWVMSVISMCVCVYY
jgi:hypothetical protein